MDDETLIECVQRYPILYDLSHTKYMDTNAKNDIWKKIGEELKIDGQSCKGRWNNIRDNYRKSLKRNETKSGQCAKKIKLYKYHDQLGFLKQYFEERSTRSNIESQMNDEVIKNNELQHEGTHTQDDVERVQETSNSENRFEDLTKLKRPKKSAEKQTAAATLMKYFISKNEKGLTSSQENQHPVDAFLASVAPSLKNLSEYHWHFAKFEIFNIVQKYEMKMLVEQQPHESRLDHSDSSASISPAQPYNEPTFHELTSPSTDKENYIQQHYHH